MNEDALSSEAAENAQNCIEVGSEQISFDSAQVAAFDLSGSCQLYFGPALAETQ
jgi:hypothetical protein